MQEKQQRKINKYCIMRLVNIINIPVFLISLAFKHLTKEVRVTKRMRKKILMRKNKLMRKGKKNKQVLYNEIT